MMLIKKVEYIKTQKQDGKIKFHITVVCNTNTII